jgi:hypothetical protein
MPLFPALPSGDNPAIAAAQDAQAAASGIAGARKKKKKPTSPGAAPGGPFDLSANSAGAPATPGPGLLDSLNANTEDI